MLARLPWRTITHRNWQMAFCSSSTLMNKIASPLSDGVGVPSRVPTSPDDKRPASKRVQDIAAQILDLTLIEAADLCDMLQDRLASKSQNSSMRSPFPYPAGMFSMPMGQPGMFTQGLPTGSPASAPLPPSGPAGGAVGSEGKPGEKGAKKVEEEEPAKSVFALKITTIPADKRVPVIKEIRAITGLGLKESKDFVDVLPKVVKRGLSPEEAEAMKKQLMGAGAVVELS